MLSSSMLRLQRCLCSQLDDVIVSFNPMLCSHQEKFIGVSLNKIFQFSDCWKSILRWIDGNVSHLYAESRCLSKLKKVTLNDKLCDYYSNSCLSVQWRRDWNVKNLSSVSKTWVQVKGWASSELQATFSGCLSNLLSSLFLASLSRIVRTDLGA